jgi:hypothetical protein
LGGANKVISKITPWNDNTGLGKVLTGIGTSFIPGLSIGGGLSKVSLGLGGVGAPGLMGTTIGGGKTKLSLGDLANAYQGYEAYRANQDSESAMRNWQNTVGAGPQPYNFTPQQLSWLTGAADWQTQNEADAAGNAYAGNASARGFGNNGSVFGNNNAGVNAGRTASLIKNRGDVVKLGMGIGTGTYNTKAGQFGNIAQVRNQQASAAGGSLAETIAKLQEALGMQGGAGSSLPGSTPPTGGSALDTTSWRGNGINPPVVRINPREAVNWYDPGKITL